MIPENLKYFFNAADLKEETTEDGTRRCIYTAENLQVVIYNFPPNTVSKLHSHDKHEQMGYLVSGKMGFKVGEKVHTLMPGDFYRAPIGVEHNAWTMEEPAVLLDFFSPIREDLVRW